MPHLRQICDKNTVLGLLSGFFNRVKINFMKILYTAQATVQGGREGTVQTRDGQLTLQLSTPKGLGGPGQVATNPEELFAAGYAACFQSALQNVAFRNKTPLPKEGTITAHVGIGKLDNGTFSLAVDMALYLPGMDQALAEELVGQAHHVCPYSNATRSNIEVKFVVETQEKVEG